MDRNTVNGKLALRPGEALLVAGLARDIGAGEKTARNKISLGTFPFRLTTIAGKKLVLVRDLLVALGEPAAAVDAKVEPSKSGRKSNEAKTLAKLQGDAHG